MRNAGLDEAQAGIKISGRNINNLRYAEKAIAMTPVFLPGESHGWRSLAGYKVQVGHKESDMTEHRHTHASMSLY